jgi:hypothetical protein
LSLSETASLTLPSEYNCFRKALSLSETASLTLPSEYNCFRKASLSETASLTLPSVIVYARLFPCRKQLVKQYFPVGI